MERRAKLDEHSQIVFSDKEQYRAAAELCQAKDYVQYAEP